MAAQVVCISRTRAALGEEVGDLVAQRLGFRYVDEQVIERAARLAQVDPKLVAAVEERQTLMRSVMEKLTAARDLLGPATLAPILPAFGGLQERERGRAKPDDLRLLIQAAIHQVASDGSAVIVAHAASMTLAARAEVLRVLVTASVETRADRLAAAEGLTTDASAAAIATSDRNRRDYIRRFHSIAQELPTHYDLVFNTDALSPAQVAATIVSAARPDR